MALEIKAAPLPQEAVAVVAEHPALRLRPHQ